MSEDARAEPPEPTSGGRAASRWWALPLRAAALLAGTVAAVILLGLIAAAIALAVAYPNLPELDSVTDYRPRLPLRVYSADGTLLGEFGDERRTFTPIAQIPPVMKQAVLAIEDARFYEHSGVDYIGVLRAGLAQFGNVGSQGASTITMQVARNFYLSSEKVLSRKLYEVLLALKIESQLSKDQILELYMNQIYLGQRAYGFEAAARAYFGKSLGALTVAESAMLAGLPQNPSYANPISNPERARKRQLVVLERMREVGVIDAAAYAKAKDEPLKVRSAGQPMVHAEFVAEMARQAVFERFGEKAYTEGYQVHTTLRAEEQQAAWRALRRGVLDYDRRQPWRGPEAEEDLPADATDADIAHALADHRDDDDLHPAIVRAASPKQLDLALAGGEEVQLGGDAIRLAQPGLAANAPRELKLRRGSVIRVMKHARGSGWVVAQWPQVQAALVALDPKDGRVRALVGGFDFRSNQFNHATQAWRQPGSSFKPFLYSAALEQGVMPATLVNDSPPDNLGSWDPKNSDNQYDGPITLRQALARSKNMVTIRLVQQVGPAAMRDWAARFGFEPERQPDNLTLALGAGATTPLQLAGAYAAIANGGLKVAPLLIERITDAQDQVLFQAPAPVVDEASRVIPARNAFLTASLLQEVTRSGTAARAQAALKRPDLYGKTGTTNDAVDAWFAGFQPGVVAAVWFGFDTPRSLGSRESGGGLALPIWIEYMQRALRGVPVQELQPPDGVVHINSDWLYAEMADGSFVHGIGPDTPVALPSAASAPAATLPASAASAAP